MDPNINNPVPAPVAGPLATPPTVSVPEPVSAPMPAPVVPEPPVFQDPNLVGVQDVQPEIVTNGHDTTVPPTPVQPGPTA